MRYTKGKKNHSAIAHLCRAYFGRTFNAVVIVRETYYCTHACIYEHSIDG